MPHAHPHAFRFLNATAREGLVVSRRGLLKAGLAGFGGLTLPGLLQARQQRGSRVARGKSVILLWMAGGPSQLDTLDPKPDRPFENRGPFGVTKTRLPGVIVCEHLPKLAAMLDRFTIIRSVDCRHSNHEPNSVMQTANLLAEPRENPEARNYLGGQTWLAACWAGCYPPAPKLKEAKMARTTCRPAATVQSTLVPQTTTCPECGHSLRLDYYNKRTVTTLEDVLGLCLGIRRCHNTSCKRHHKPLRPEAEGRIALPHHEFGLDVVAFVGSLRYREHRTIAEIHEQLTARQVTLAPRSVTNLLNRYDELLALATLDPKRLHPKLLEEGRVILAVDGLQPDAGHEVLWVIRDCLSGEILLAEALLSSTQGDLEKLIRKACAGLPVPVVAAVSDGQKTIRNAVAAVLPTIPHQLCHFHFLREAGKPIYEMDRHAKKELKKTVRDIRVLERQVENQEGPQAEAVMGYCQAVRSSLTDDGRPPLGDKGLLLHERLEKIAASIERVAQKGG